VIIRDSRLQDIKSCQPSAFSYQRFTINDIQFAEDTEPRTVVDEEAKKQEARSKEARKHVEPRERKTFLYFSLRYKQRTVFRRKGAFFAEQSGR